MSIHIHDLIGNIGKVSHREEIERSGLDPHLALLRVWQAERLARTYADLLEQPRYRSACLFFLEDIYAARDFSQRDHDLETMYDFMRRFVPDAVSRPAALTIKLHRMTEVLDRQLLDVLVNQLGVTDSITVEQYAEGYRRCDNYRERVEQIDAIIEICEHIDGIVRNRITGPALSIAKRPLRGAGYGEVVTFLERGYDSFKRMHGSRHFRKTLQEREMGILDRFYANDPEPFRLEMPVRPTPEEASTSSETDGAANS
jgi:hypothetical protein